MSIALRPVETEAELEAYVRIWNAITPDEPTNAPLQRDRRARDPQRLYLLSWADGAPVASGFAGGSDSPDRTHVAIRVLTGARRQGVGSAALRLCDHLTQAYGLATVTAKVAGRDHGSLAFARRFGFEEVDREVEQVIELGGRAGCP